VESSAVAAVPLPRLADLVVAADRPGRWLTLRFAVEAGEAGDVRFHLVRRLDAVAPAAADGALRDSRYDKPLLVQVGR